MAQAKDEFIELFQTHIKREGADKLLEYLCSSQCDFFTAPASTRSHGSYRGGLVEHSLNVYHCLKDYLKRARVNIIWNTVRKALRLRHCFMIFVRLTVIKSVFATRKLTVLGNRWKYLSIRMSCLMVMVKKAFISLPDLCV